MNIEDIKIGMEVVVNCLGGIYTDETNIEFGDVAEVVGIDGGIITLNKSKWNGHDDGGLQDNDHNWCFLPEDLSSYNAGDVL